MKPFTIFGLIALFAACAVQAKDTWADSQKFAEKQTTEFLTKYPSVQSDSFVFKTIKLPNGNSLALDLRIERPKEKKLCPVVFFVHGGGWGAGSKGAFCPQSFELAKHGIAGVRIEYRLKGQGGKFTNVIKDVLDAIDFIRHRKDELVLDFTRVGLAGGSAGGHLSSIAAQLTPECISYDGYNGLFDAFQRDGSRFGGGNYTGTTEAQKKNASAIYIIKDKPPHTLLYHGTADTTIVPKQAHRFAQAIRDKGGQADVLIYEGAGHSFFNKEPYLSVTTKALLAHTSFVFGMTDHKPNLQDYNVEPTEALTKPKKKKERK
ncbi:alpha/beta hydrolase [Lentisphaera profundi]|uniref:Alpha/beta hydrolase n=1 Tax=Lentisphaera profundi TaxID=1658616 RepID=A0ABY7VPI3_9BACT|nr:alpha/beta hydrolase [Lentisphaera profundi]WDE96060.1 alpha/beta hydrolase [Lentisphaera profundi]